MTAQWNALDWNDLATLSGAAATLIAGLGAVIGATMVGLRQAGITERQVEIAANQHALERLKVRQDIFDRRLKVYEHTRTWLAYILAHGATPSRAKEPATVEGFAEAWDISRFLFKPDVHNSLETLRLMAIDLDYHEAMTINPVRTDPDGGVTVSEEDHPASATRLMMGFRDAMQNLSEMFGSELQLSDDAIEALIRPDRKRVEAPRWKSSSGLATI